MIFTSALCLVLVVSSSLAHQDNSDQPDELTMGIVSEVVDAIRTAAESGRQLHPQELNNLILNRVNSVLTRVKPQLNKLYKLSEQRGVSVGSLARSLALKISQSDAFNDALSGPARHQPRAVGALVLGITQIITDVVKMSLTRY